MRETGNVKTKYADRDDDEVLQFQHGDDESKEAHGFTEIDALLARTSKITNPPEALNHYARKFWIDLRSGLGRRGASHGAEPRSSRAKAVIDRRIR